MPAYEWRVRDLAACAAAISAHNERRLAELLDPIGRMPGAAPWHLPAELTWSRPMACLQRPDAKPRRHRDGSPTRLRQEFAAGPHQRF